MTPGAKTGMVGIPAAAIAAVHSALAKGRTAAEAADLARRVGFALGPALVDAFQEVLDAGGEGPASELEPERFWTRLTEFLGEAGWGELIFEDAHPGVASLSSPSWAEATGRSTAHPSCHITTGMIAAVVSRVAGTDLAVLEARCRAAGADRCTFLVGGQTALGTVYARLRDGARPAEAVSALG